MPTKNSTPKMQEAKKAVAPKSVIVTNPNTMIFSSDGKTRIRVPLSAENVGAFAGEKTIGNYDYVLFADRKNGNKASVILKKDVIIK